MVKKTTAKKGGSNVGKAIGVGVGIAALSAAAYLLMGPDGKKNRKAVKAWTVKMKAEVAEKIENMKEVTAPMYEKIVAQVADKYKKVKNIDAKDVEAEINSLKKHWKDMTKPAVKKVKKTVKKVIK
jgi:gas vesicle protein